MNDGVQTRVIIDSCIKHNIRNNRRICFSRILLVRKTQALSYIKTASHKTHTPRRRSSGNSTQRDRVKPWPDDFASKVQPVRGGRRRTTNKKKYTENNNEKKHNHFPDSSSTCSANCPFNVIIYNLYIVAIFTTII